MLKEQGRDACRWLATNCQENSGEQRRSINVTATWFPRGNTPEEPRRTTPGRRAFLLVESVEAGLGSNRAADTLRGWILHSTLADAMVNRADVHAGRPFSATVSIDTRMPLERARASTVLPNKPREIVFRGSAFRRSTWHLRDKISESLFPS